MILLYIYKFSKFFKIIMFYNFIVSLFFIKVDKIYFKISIISFIMYIIFKIINYIVLRILWKDINIVLKNKARLFDYINSKELCYIKNFLEVYPESERLFNEKEFFPVQLPTIENIMEKYGEKEKFLRLTSKKELEKKYKIIIIIVICLAFWDFIFFIVMFFDINGLYLFLLFGGLIAFFSGIFGRVYTNKNIRREHGKVTDKFIIREKNIKIDRHKKNAEERENQFERYIKAKKKN